MRTSNKNIIIVLLLLCILALSQLFRLVVFEDFKCDVTSDSCETIQTNIIGSKNKTLLFQYSDLSYITYMKGYSPRAPKIQYHQLEAITKYQEHKLISTKKYYDFQNYPDVIKLLNDKILKQESFSYRFWGLSNRYGEMY